jgi:hypothetical protein
LATMGPMATPNRLQDCAAELVEAAGAFQTVAEQPASYADAPESLASLERALRVLSAAWYQLAADASRGIVARRGERASEAGAWPRVDGLSREQESQLMATLHDVAASFARCARVCRDARSTAAPIVDRRVEAERTREPQSDDGLSWFEGNHPSPNGWRGQVSTTVESPEPSRV